MTPFFAFLHHLAAFTLVAALAVEFVLIRGELNLRTARRLRLVDMVFGMSSGVVLVVADLEAWEAKPTVPTDPVTNKPFTSQRTGGL